MELIGEICGIHLATLVIAAPNAITAHTATPSGKQTISRRSIIHCLVRFI
jgi:hypothetical protein